MLLPLGVITSPAIFKTLSAGEGVVKMVNNFIATAMT